MSAPTATRHHYGPSALGEDARRFWRLTYTLAVTDFKLRYFGSALGYAWSLIRPLLFFGVLYVIFTKVADIGTGVKFYAAYLLTSIMLFTFFSEATTGAARSLVDREKPPAQDPVPTARRADLGDADVVPEPVGELHRGAGVRARHRRDAARRLARDAIPRRAALRVLARRRGLLSALFVRFRDIQPIWEVSVQILFYASPILFVISKYPDNIERPMLCNPLAVILTQMRHAFLDPSAPSAAQAIGGAPRLLIPLGVIVLTCALGYWVFNREAPRIAENL